MQDALIIDDIESALAAMTNVGERILTDLSFQIRSGVLALAEKRCWSVVRHGDYSKWALDTAAKSDLPWVILDPLISLRTAAARHQRACITRGYVPADALVSVDMHCDESTRGALAAVSGGAGVLDDAVSSGRTLLHVAKRFLAQTAAVVQVAVCASSRMGRDLVIRHLRVARWSQYLDGDWMTAHLRDGCPYLPYTGRATSAAPIAGVNGCSVPVRIPVSRVRGHVWEAILQSREVREAVEQGKWHAHRAFSEILGRDATVSDLPLLGESVPAFVEDDAPVTVATRLDRLGG